MPNFFGLPDEYMKSVYDKIFQMNYHGPWTFTEVYNFPIRLRDYYYDLLREEKKEENERVKKAKNS